MNVTLAGTQFTSPATVTMQGSAITVSNVVVVNANTITATIHVGAASRRSHSTAVTTGAGTSNSVSFIVQ